MSKPIYVINGPNLNLLGHREPEIYGHETLGDVERTCADLARHHQLELRFFQSNAEHELIDWIQEAREAAAGIIINPAAYSHTSIAILDALRACSFPVLEVHVSNIHQREPFRHHSHMSARADGVIVGCGTQGYELAVLRMARLLSAGR
ncbi:type II 3-dehydroquinate dehydratase [Roseibium aquae]|uniref:type II 3-dehydroquinate dehydratase n=1 Tax=Roseibium aquae TaxID=1323746 RepID=UPI00123E09B7|nr:type II 3-dehydroquinate dehydratase [Roseibium aquae]